MESLTDPGQLWIFRELLGLFRKSWVGVLGLAVRMGEQMGLIGRALEPASAQQYQQGTAL